MNNKVSSKSVQERNATGNEIVWHEDNKFLLFSLIGNQLADLGN